MKIIKSIPLILICTLLIGILLIVSWIKLTIFNLERDVRSYLQNEKQYQKTDIIKLKGHFSKLPTFDVQVSFKDEQQFIYYYMRDQGKIVQYNCTSINTFEKGCKHKE